MGGCNCGGGRGRDVTVTAAASNGGGSYTTASGNVKFRHWSENKARYNPGDGHTDYNTPGEADAAVAMYGGRAQKVDQATGLPLD